jgi:Ca-activated chloride channel family protein
MLGFAVAFRSPVLLLVLLAVPVGVALYLWVDRSRARRAASWSSPALLPNMLVGRPGRKRYVPVALFGLALLLLLLGFARPEAKFRRAQNGATVVLLVDTSGSMAANDVRPSRLLAADAAITQFVQRLPSGYRASLLTFSTGIAVAVPPTDDHAALIHGLPKQTQLDGTAIGDALEEALLVAKKAVGPSKPGAPHPPATILLVSDGGQNAGAITPTAAATQARKAAIPVSTVAVGTATGAVHQQVPLGRGGRTFPLVQQVPVEPAVLTRSRG